ncbi:MAG: efflux RND transporter periplasmic adaptor subunit [Saprospiraceae bacterium]|nr:efflux RND transporter periplasmic adaptor subunit [Saprospiraceae bacterium]MBK7737963.1 efflux RND transporter periplasmic adaptor subunit [Saprospiraceae bacterium]MBK7913458.1 efflux RND transporter periplasmic adaptor subunit [Saprospiraceae bacterium]
MNQKKGLRWWWWLAIILIPVLIVAAVFKAKNKPKGEEVNLEKVQTRDIVETVTASGKIFPETEIKISSDVSGEIVELYVKEGDSVKVGQILAKVNADAYTSAVERSSAGVNIARTQASTSGNSIENAKQQKTQAKLQYENAKKMHQRNQQLYKDGIISLADLESSETTMKNLEAGFKAAEIMVENAIKGSESASFQVKDAEALLKEQRTNLGRTIIKAPATGIISKLNVERGERVVGTMQMSGTELMRIADLHAMEVQVEVSENDIVNVKTGDEATIEVDAYQNKKFSGHVTEVANSANNISSIAGNSLSTDQVTKFVVKIRIEKSSYADLVVNNRAPFRPGMSATVEINTHEVKNVLSVPIQAVIAYDPNEEVRKAKEKKDRENKSQQPTAQAEVKEVDDSPYREALFVVHGDTVSRVDVEIGIQDENYIEIKSGISEGDEVVIGPYVALSRKLKNGSKIHRKVEDSKKE